MNINLSVLEKEFIGNSPRVRCLKSRELKIKEKMTDIIIREVNKDISPEEREVLRKFSKFYTPTAFSFGSSFYNSHPEKGGLISYSKILIPSNYPMKCDGRPDFPEDVIKELIPLNDQIIEILSEIKEISESFERLVNRDTSLVWLRKNLPGVYEKAKDISK